MDKESLSSEKGPTWVLEQKVEALAQLELEVVVMQIHSLNRSIARLEPGHPGGQPEAQRLPQSNQHQRNWIARRRHPTLVDWQRERLRPRGETRRLLRHRARVQDSNETERRGRITKRGSKLGRTALVQCALIAKRYSPYLHRYYERIRARRGTGKAIIALASQVPQRHLSHA